MALSSCLHLHWQYDAPHLPLKRLVVGAPPTQGAGRVRVAVSPALRFQAVDLLWRMRPYRLGAHV